MMQLVPWEFHTSAGFTLRGMRSLPSGKPLLHVLHGNGFCSQMYLPLLEPLQSQVDFFLSDVQGHGQSEHGSAFVGWNMSATLAAEALLAHRHCYSDVPVFALGHSFGGVLTALLHSTDDSPFQSVLLLDPVIFTPGMLHGIKLLALFGLYRHNPMAKKALKRRQFFADYDDAWRYFHQRGMFKSWHPDALAAYIRYGLKVSEHGLQLNCAPAREADIFGSYPTRLWQSLRRTQKPVEIVYGGQSYPFVAKSARHFQKLCSHLVVQQVAGGHCFMQEDPITTARLVSHWLSQQQAG